MDVDEFIDIQCRDPVGALNDLHGIGVFIGGELYAALLVRAVIAHMAQHAHGVQPVEHQVSAILTIVGKDEEIREPAGPVMGQPFQQEGAFVAHR